MNDLRLLAGAGVPAAGVLIRWLFARRAGDDRPNWLSRSYAWACRIVSANKRLADLQANLERDNRAAAQELAGLRQDVDRVAADSTRLRAELSDRQAENQTLRQELARLRGSGPP